jgi:hypothetical protein
MCSLGIDLHRSCLYSGDLELKGIYEGFIFVPLVPIGVFIEIDPHDMTKAPIVQALPL